MIQGLVRQTEHQNGINEHLTKQSNMHHQRLTHVETKQDAFCLVQQEHAAKFGEIEDRFRDLTARIGVVETQAHAASSADNNHDLVSDGGKYSSDSGVYIALHCECFSHLIGPA